MFEFFNSQPWVRPALFALSAIAVLVKAACPPNTVAHKVADWVVNATVPLAAGSFGRSNSGLKPGEKA